MRLVSSLMLCSAVALSAALSAVQPKPPSRSMGGKRGRLGPFKTAAFTEHGESVAASEEDRPLFADERAFVGCDSSTASIRSIISFTR
jgi:hypothetical protein